MARHIFYRDFTLCKAALLVVLMGLALASGSESKGYAASAVQDGLQNDAHRILPAVLDKAKDGCPEWKGTEL